VTGTDHVVADQSAVFDGVERLLARGGTAVRRIDTHGAVVFLAGADAYKIKRAVRFPFMDLSTLEKRRRACEAEVAVNRDNAPALYVRAVPITAGTGGLALAGDGPALEWAVHMRRFDETMTLDLVAARAGLSRELLAATAGAVAASHERAPQRPDFGFSAKLAALITENGASLQDAGARFGRERVATLTRESLARHGALAALMRRRGAAGKVRLCHGDLHLRNIVLIEGVPVLFDAIEFDETIATTDILYDLAFLLMDLWAGGLTEEANLVLNRYLIAHRDVDDLDGLALLPLFISVRAMIRAKVTVANLAHLQGTERARAEADAEHYVGLAQEALAPAPLHLVAIGGLSGTGKSTLAGRIAPLVGRLPGAVHLRSDVERKQAKGVEEFDQLPASAYDRATTAAVYATLARKAERALLAGHSVVVDAVHARPEERQAMAALAERSGASFTGLWLEAPTDVLLGRVAARHGDASDADQSVVEAQARYDLGRLDWVRLDAGGEAGAVLGRALRALRALGVVDETRPPQAPSSPPSSAPPHPTSSSPSG
jgi:aminoglycoside phosphotransferase family enzyme/predicted kinase